MKPSAETRLRHANRRIRELEGMLTKIGDERERYRARATKAEQGEADWKRRFDALLERTPVRLTSPTHEPEGEPGR